ncbi:MAG: hypothetical protein IIB28_03795 [Chloroflexi bacterium]|nr:hypothetical protein [Chloroflexota bacterium]
MSSQTAARYVLYIRLQGGQRARDIGWPAIDTEHTPGGAGESSQTQMIDAAQLDDSVVALAPHQQPEVALADIPPGIKAMQDKWQTGHKLDVHMGFSSWRTAI